MYHHAISVNEYMCIHIYMYMFLYQVKAVHYPGLESHPGHKTAKKQMKSFSGMMAFDMNTLEEAKTVVEVIYILKF